MTRILFVFHPRYPCDPRLDLVICLSALSEASDCHRGTDVAALRAEIVARRRRNRELDIALGMAQLLVLLVFTGMFVPQIRQILLGLSALLIGGVILVGILALGVLLIRLIDRKPSAVSTATFDSWPSSRSLAIAPGSPEIRPAGAPDLLEQLRAIDWFQFEKLVALVYRKLGYQVTRRGGASPDGGIDLVIEKDGQRSAVQCKQWKTWNVGVKAVREFLGALTDAGIQKGVFITLCGYTGDAKQLAEKHGIEIVNETGLAMMIKETDARFDPEALAILNDDRKFCPKCEAEMVLRTAGRGDGAGRQFWGCSKYPRCRFTMPTA